MSDVDISQEAVEKLATWCGNAAAYFKLRPDGGEDMAHWANIANSDTSGKIAATLRALALAVKANRERDLRLVEFAVLDFCDNSSTCTSHEETLTAFEAQEKERK